MPPTELGNAPLFPMRTFAKSLRIEGFCVVGGGAHSLALPPSHTPAQRSSSSAPGRGTLKP